ncbi:MAG: TolC family protein [Rhodanobacteraceae bacterium]|nr:MAG: TolC family protein [Rhodanobacteraceae bacterium]
MKSVWIGLFTLALAACASVPPPRTLDPKLVAHDFAGRRLDAAGLARAETRFGLSGNVAAPWTPDRITVAAWYFDPILAQARAAARSAEANATLSAQRTNPTLKLSPEKVFSGLAGPNPWTIGVAVLLPLLHPGEAQARRAAATAETIAARDQAAEALWQSRARAIAALRDVLFSRRAENLTQAVVHADTLHLDALRQQQTAGEIDRNAVLAAELERQRAEADLASRRVQDAKAGAALASAIGVPRAALSGVTLRWPGLDTPPAPSALPRVALAKDAVWNRLDLAVLLQRYRAAEAHLREAAGSRYPQLAIAPGYLYDQRQRKFTFGVDVELPLFHGAGARIRAAAAGRDEAAANVRAKQASIFNQLDAARAQYALRYAAWRRMADAAAKAHELAARAEVRRTAGQVGRPAVLTANIAADTAELNAESALSQVWAALGALEDAVQQPLWPASQLPLPSVQSAAGTPTPPTDDSGAAHVEVH